LRETKKLTENTDASRLQMHNKKRQKKTVKEIGIQFFRGKIVRKGFGVFGNAPARKTEGPRFPAGGKLQFQYEGRFLAYNGGPAQKNGRKKKPHL